MGEMLSLLKVQLLGLFGVNKFIHKKKNGKKAKTGIAILLLVLIIALLGSYVYYYTKSYFNVSEGFYDTTSVKKFYSLVFFIIFCLSFITVLFDVLGGFYKSKDMELILSFPVKKIYIVISKILRIIAFEIIVVLFAFIFSYLAILKKGVAKDCNMFFVFLSLLFCGFIPTFAGFIVGTIILYICSFLKGKNFWQTIFVTAFLIGCIFLPKAFGKKTNFVFVELKKFGKWAFSGSRQFCLYFVISVFSLTFAVILINLIYMGIRSAVSKVKYSKKTRKNKTNTPFISEIKRNLKCFFSNTAYSVNSLIGPILTVLLGSISITFRNENLFFDGEPKIIGQIIFIIFMTLTIFFVGTGAPSSVAISIEGKTLWVLRSSPVKEHKILFSKFILCLLPSFISLSYTLIMFNLFIVKQVDAIAIWYSLSVGIGLPIVISSWGLFINLLLPSLDWEKASQVVKRSASAGVFLGLTFSFSSLQSFFTAIYFKVKKQSISSFLELFKVQTIFTFSVVALLALSGVILLFTVGVKRFKKLS